MRLSTAVVVVAVLATEEHSNGTLIRPRRASVSGGIDDAISLG